MVNIYSLEKFGSGLFMSKSELLSIGNHGVVHSFIDFVTISTRCIASFIVMMKLIQYPHDVMKDKKGDEVEDHEIQKVEDQSYVWDTFFAFLMMIVGTTNSNEFIFELFSSKLFHSIHDITLEGNTQVIDTNMTVFFHQFLRYAFIITKVICTLVGFIFFVINTCKRNTFNWKFPGIGEMILFTLEVVVFVLGIIITFIYGFTMSPTNFNFSDDLTFNEFLETRITEFSFEVLNDSILSFSCIMLVVFFYFTKNKVLIQKNKLIFSFPLRTIFLGLYTTTLSCWQMLSFHYSGLHSKMNDWEILLPLIVYLVSVMFVIVLQVIYELENTDSTNGIKKAFFDFMSDLGMMLGHKSFAIIFWRIGIVFGIVSTILIVVSYNGAWFRLKIHSGTIPSRVLSSIEIVEDAIVNVADDAFNAMKKLDPCRWDPATGDSDDINSQNKNEITYTHSLIKSDGTVDNSTQSTHTLNLKQSSVTNFDLKDSNFCKSTSSDGGTCNKLNEHVKGINNHKRKTYGKFVNDETFKNFYDHQSFHTFEDTNSEYEKKIASCHNDVCETIFFTAIGFQAMMAASDIVGMLPFVGEAEETAVEWTVWFGQIANRVFHGTVSFGKTIYHFIRGLGSKIKTLGKMFESMTKFIKIAAKSENSFVKMSVDTYVIYTPSILFGGVCFLLGFWKRDNTKTPVKNVTNLTLFFLPLLFANVMMTVMMFVFPYIVTEIFKVLPKELIVVFMNVETPFRIARLAFVFSSLGILFIVTSIVLDLYEKVLPTYKRVRRGIKRIMKEILPGRIFTGGYVQGVSQSKLIENGGPCNNYLDVNWCQGFFISSLCFLFIFFIFVQNLNLIDFRYGPSGDMIKIMEGFDSHAHVLAHSKRSKDDVEAFTCGLVGKALEKIIDFAIDVIKNGLESIVEHLENLLESIKIIKEVMSAVEHTGSFLVEIFDETWRTAEKLLVMIIPFVNTFLFALGAYISAKKNRIPDTETKEDLVQIESMIFKAIGVLAIHNIVFILMLQQLFSSVKEINLFLFYFEAKIGIMSTYALISSGLNLLGLMNIYISNMYPLS